MTTDFKKIMNIDEQIMTELLSQPEIFENVSKMTEKELEFFREMLIKQGIYARYCQERNEKAGE